MEFHHLLAKLPFGVAESLEQLNLRRADERAQPAFHAFEKPVRYGFLNLTGQDGLVGQLGQDVHRTDLWAVIALNAGAQPAMAIAVHEVW
jgi:hypothetical protein